jgi:hypothetical protein
MGYKMEIYTGDKTYMYPTGGLATPEKVLADYPAILTFPHVIETDELGQVFYGINNLSGLRSMRGVDPSLTNEEAVKALEEMRNAPPPEPEISPDERMASAMEYQNMMAMEDVEE